MGLADSNPFSNKADSLYIVKKEFSIYSPEKITEIYKCAIFNGFESNWAPTHTVC